MPESLEYIRPLHSLYGQPLFQKVPKILPKMPKNCLWGILSEAKCCSLVVQRKICFSETNSICMDFICLQWLAAGILSGRNNGPLSCYIEFCIRAKTGFSYIFDFFKLCLHGFRWCGGLCVYNHFFSCWWHFLKICQIRNVSK